MNPFRKTFLVAALIAATLIATTLCLANAALAGEPTKAEEEEAAKKLAELQQKLLAADLVVRAKVANTLAAGDKAVIVLSVRETFRGATARKAIYVETSKETATDLDDKETIWFLRATADPRRFTLAGPSSILDAERADEIKTAFEKIEYAALDDLKFTVSLDKETYKLDEPIRLTWTIENRTDKPIVIAVPETWGAGLAIGLIGLSQGQVPLDTGDIHIARGIGDDTVLLLPADSDAARHGARFTFATLGAGRREELGTASLLRLVRSYGETKEHPSGSLLGPGRYMLRLAIDSTGAAEPDDALAPAEARLGSLDSDRILFDVGDERLDSLDDAKSILAKLAEVDDVDTSIESSNAGTRARLLEAVRDYSCPALLPLLQTMLRADDLKVQAAACDALLMWARHPTIIKARPFAELLEDLDVQNPSLIARTGADLAEAQNDATMVPLLLKALKNEKINKISRQSIALSIGAIASLEIDETDLDEAVAVIENWVEKHPEQVNPPEGE